MSVTIAENVKGISNQILVAMKGYLGKAKDHASQNGIEDSAYLNSRLFVDMHPMVKQIQLATDFSVRGVARLSNQELPSFPDNEETFADLIARIDKAIAFISAGSDDAINANEDVVFNLPAGPDVTIPLAGKAYVSTYIVPNLIFHSSTAYGILRSQGVPLGKRDFLMPAGFTL